MVVNRLSTRFGAFRAGWLSVALALVLAGCGGASSAESPTDQDATGELSKVRIIVPVAGTISLTYSVAEANGLFKKYGISTTLVASQGGGPDIAALAAGSVDFDIVCACGIISAFQNGNDLTWSYVVADEPVGILVMRKSLAEERGITPTSSFEERLAAFANTTVGNTSPGGFMHFMIEYYQKKYGLEGIKEVAVGGGATAPARGSGT